MNIRRIAREDVYSRLDTPYNPPARAADGEAACLDFYEEWHAARNGLLTVLERFGEHDDYNDKEFNLGDVAMLSRGIGVTFTNQTMINPQVLEAVAAFLAALPEDYEVNITLQRDGKDDHDLFISRDTVLAELPDDLFCKIIPAAWV